MNRNASTYGAREGEVAKRQNRFTTHPKLNKSNETKREKQELKATRKKNDTFEIKISTLE